MESVLICLCLLYLTVVPTESLLLTTAKVSYLSVSWNNGLQTPGCQLLGHSLHNATIEDIRVRGVSSGENEYWIGAHVQYTKWIKLVGCYNTWIDNMSSDNNSKSVLECYQKCGGTDFGLSVKGCVCDIRADRTAVACMATTCIGHINDICGTADVTSGLTCLCFYEIKNISSDNEIGNCQVVEPIGSRTRSTMCSEEHGFICQNRGSFHYNKKTLNWTEARLACIRREAGHVYNTSNPIGNPELYWGSVFRKQISTWGDITPQETEFDCLAASISGEGKLIPFIRKCDTKLPLLCDQPQQKQAEGNVEIKNNDSLPRNEVVTEDTIEENRSIPENKGEQEKFSVPTLILGAACGILLTVIVMIISMIIYRLSRKKPNVPQNMHQEVTPPETVGIQYEHLRTDDREGGNIYNVLGPSSDSYGYITVI